MSSQADIANIALTILGKPTIACTEGEPAVAHY
jgi:hypothetical protein